VQACREEKTLMKEEDPAIVFVGSNMGDSWKGGRIKKNVSGGSCLWRTSVLVLGR